MRIQNHGAALITARKTGIRLARSTERLASGLRINSAADDASGLAISEKMKAQIRGLNAAEGNMQDGISLVQTADGALEEVHASLQRIRELSVKAANGIFTDGERSALQEEMDQLLLDIDRIASGTTFNNIPLLDGSCEEAPAIPGDRAVYRADINFDQAQDGSYIVVDGVKLEFDTDGSLSDPAAVAVDVSSALDGADRAAAFQNALQGSPVKDNFDISFAGAGSTVRLTLTAKKSEKGQTIQPEYKTVMDVSSGDLEKFEDTVWDIVNYTIGDIQPETIKNGSTFIVNDILFEFYENDPADVQAPAPPINQVFPVKLGPGQDDTFLAFADALFNNLAVFTPSGDPQRTALLGENTSVTPTTWSIDVIDDLSYPNPPADITNIGFNLDNSVPNKLAGTNEESIAGKEDIPANNGLILQIGINSGDTIKISIEASGTKDLGLDELSLRQVETAGTAMEKVDGAIDKVSKNRSGLGAVQNRLERTVDNLKNIEDNLSAANSRIRDTDMAKAMSNKTREAVLMSTTEAIMAQVNTHMGDMLQILK